MATALCQKFHQPCNARKIDRRQIDITAYPEERQEVLASLVLGPACKDVAERLDKVQLEDKSVMNSDENRDEGNIFEGGRPKKLEVEQAESITNKSWFEENFIDPRLYFLKEDVQERLERFAWLCGPYGVTGRNKKFPFVHLFVTVKRRKSFSKSRVRDDIEKEFGKKALKFVEVLREPKKRPSIKFMTGRAPERQRGPNEQHALVRPAPGGGISVVKDVDHKANPLLTSEQREFLNEDLKLSEKKALGTLTLFCLCDDTHYGLTCYHVVCDNDSVRFSDAFQDNPGQVFEQISSDAENKYSVTRSRSFRYHHRGDQMNEPNNNEGGALEDIVLGTFANGHFGAICDIASVEIYDGLQLNCTIVETNFPCDRKYIMDEFKNGNPIKVEKDGYATEKTTGNLIHLGNYLDDRVGLLFKNAFFVKRDSPGAKPFLEHGDSGSLVSYYRYGSDGQTKYAFAYGVCEVEGLHLPPSGWSSDESSDRRGSDSKAGSSDDSSDWSSDDTSDTSDDDGHSQGSVESSNGADDEADSSSAHTSGHHDGKIYICLDLQTALERIGLKNPCIGTCNRC